ncbi:hypothetical protein [Wukongibacter sp. M2B1]|uniref:hypothetical protein n=1 Tax=Wukongibacter sp. M2B1 TaxID=3088895 RepID=UPI003D7A7988
MKKKPKLFLYSLIISFITIFFQSYVKVSPIRYSLGFPIKFISYIGKNPPQNSFQLFWPRNIKHISFEFGNYIISTLIIYLGLKLLLFTMHRLNMIKQSN